jgi:heme-degrading monooxygenase HmoA
MRTLPLFLSACTAASPFAGPGWDDGLTTDAPGPFIAVATHTRATAGRESTFDLHVDAIKAQLETQPGLVGSSLRGRIPGRERWTLTVWEDEESIVDFVVAGAHAEAMSDYENAIEGIYYATWTVEADELPLDWSDALDRLKEVEPDELW